MGTLVSPRSSDWIERRRAYDRAYRAAHRDKANVRSRVYQAANREIIIAKKVIYNATHRESARAYARARRGCSPEYFEEMLSAQEWCCAICSAEIGVGASADHDHGTGMQRGLLCAKCNMAIGLLGDEPDVCVQAGSYLKDYA